MNIILRIAQFAAAAAEELIGLLAVLISMIVTKIASLIDLACDMVPSDNIFYRMNAHTWAAGVWLREFGRRRIESVSSILERCDD